MSGQINHGRHVVITGGDQQAAHRVRLIESVLQPDAAAGRQMSGCARHDLAQRRQAIVAVRECRRRFEPEISLQKVRIP